MTSRVSPVLAWLGLRRPAALFTYAKTHFLGILLFSTGFAPGSNLLALLNIVAIAAWAAQQGARILGRHRHDKTKTGRFDSEELGNGPDAASAGP